LPTAPPRQASVRSDRRKHKTPLGWLPWALLGLLALLLLLALLAGTLVGGNDNDARTRTSGSSAAAAAGTLTVGSTDLLASRADLGRIGSLSGGQASGRAVTVQSVVADEGFWVGSSTTDRVFVHLTPQARKTNGESPFQVKAGQRIDLAGAVVRLSGGGPSALGVTDTEGARQLAQQGAYIDARTVRLSS
jgi:hypothetical protein